MKVALMTETTHNPFNETHRVSCLRENLTSSSKGEGLETFHGLASEAPPDERGGNRYAQPTATAPHLDSTMKGGSGSQG